MMLADVLTAFEVWLKTSVFGIILLGALGSFAAVVLTRLARTLVKDILPAPFKFHEARSLRQAFFLGYSHAVIDQDKTGKWLVSFLFFHACRLIVFLIFFILCAIVFAALIATQSTVTLTTGGVITISIGFIALYMAYFEFEYVYRSYLFFWKSSLKKSIERHQEDDAVQSDTR